MRAEFQEFHRSQFHAVVTFLRLNGASLHEAEDAAQEAFLAAWQEFSEPGRWYKIDNPEGWIRTVALRRYRRPPGPRRRILATPVADILVGMDPDHDPVELSTQAQYVMSLLLDLDEDTRAVMAFNMEGFSGVETALALKISDQRVRNLLKKGRKQLARSLANDREQKRKRGGA